MFGGGGAPQNGAGNAEMISCEEALSVIYEFLDGELEEVSEQQVRAHFDVCQRCYPQLRLEESFRAAVQNATRGEAAPPEPVHELRSALRFQSRGIRRIEG